MKKYILVLFLLFSFAGNLFPQLKRVELTEASHVSMLTCTPSDDQIYALFGHTALRICDPLQGVDYVFDYGTFDYDSDNFIFRFVKGETDYMVSERPFDHFLFIYNYRSSGVTEQIFNLTLAERQAVFDALMTNILPENSVYRYNFFYDNCATRPRDIIAKALDGEIEYIPFTEEQTYRDLLDECLVLTPWVRFGINLVVGSDADKIITERQKDFLPEYVSNALGKAKIKKTDGSVEPLVSSTSELLQAKDAPLRLLEAKKNEVRAVDYPLIAGVILLLVAILVSYLSYIKRKRGVAVFFDTLLFLSAGLAGCIIFFLTFFSEHPCVDKNWNLVWLNPLALLLTPFFYVKSATKYVISYHFINFVALSLFLLGYIFIPQKLEVAFIPYILTLCIRAGVNVLGYMKIKR